MLLWPSKQKSNTQIWKLFFPILAFAHLSSVVLVSKKWFWFRFVFSMPERSQFRVWAGGNPLKASLIRMDWLTRDKNGWKHGHAQGRLLKYKNLEGHKRDCTDSLHHKDLIAC